MLIKEEWIHWIWSSGSFRSHNLHTGDGQRLSIQGRGIAHQDSGPDFPECLLRLDDTTWAGSVEIHVKASDWNRHGHQHDPAYNNVILHVVWEADAQVFREDGSAVPSLELKNLVAAEVVERLRRLHGNPGWIACSGMLRGLPKHLPERLLSEALEARMMAKSDPLLQLARICNFHWEQVCYVTLAANFGFRTNKHAFTRLAESLDYRILLRHRHHPFQLEALLFGQSGLLQGQKDEYARLLLQEYRFLKAKYSLQPVQANEWKFLRMRPLNFPTLRIAQFAALMQQHEHLFDRITTCTDADALLQLFDIRVSGYWENHYRFSLPSPPGVKRLGTEAGMNILVNTVAPIMFAYGRYLNEQNLMQRATTLLRALPPEKNRLVRAWASEGVQARNAGESQALTGHWKTRCMLRSCLQCPAGQHLAGLNT